MCKFVLIPFVVLLACTKHNPESCCSTPDQCTSFELPGITPCESGQVCDATGTCVRPQCTTSTDCTDAAMPFCENQLCVAACGSDADCTSMTGKPYCASSGACVACLEDSACTAQAPVCDGSASACRGCEKDSECASGVCLESNGTCADPADVVWVSDNGSDIGDCTQSNPCLTLQYAIPKVFSPRNVLKIMSTTFSTGVATLALEIDGFIDGTNTTLSPSVSGSGSIILVSGGDVTISDITLGDVQTTAAFSAQVTNGRLTLFGGTAKFNVSAPGGTLEIDRSILEGELSCGSGATVMVTTSTLQNDVSGTCAFDLESDLFEGEPILTAAGPMTVQNNVFVATDPVEDGPLLGGSGTFRFNTLVNL